jgi:hypothetical protein
MSDDEPKSKTPLKIVVFDLDETLGCFTEVGMFWDVLNHLLNESPTNNTFYNILDLFPNFLRPHIFLILQYVIDQRSQGKCHQLMIYTNNQGPRSWVKLISDYFNYKLGVKVFDQIIAAFKVNGEIVEVKRTTQNKCVDDLFNCTQLSTDTEIFFLDDQYHPLMDQQNVFYITVQPYYFSLPFHEMAAQFYDNNFIKEPSSKTEFVHQVKTYMSRYSTYQVVLKAPADQEIDKIVSKKLLDYLEELQRVSHSAKNASSKKTKKKNSERKRHSWP